MTSSPLYDSTHPHGVPAAAPTTVPSVAAVCVRNAAGQVLVGFNKKRFVWDVPQGVVEAEDEDVGAASLRELEEETGLVLPFERLQLLSFFQHRIPEFVFPFRTTLYLAQLENDESDAVVNREPDKCEHLLWMAPCQLPHPRGLSLRMALTLLGH